MDLAYRQQTSFTATARQQLPWLYSLARRLVGDAAEEAVRECLARAHHRREELPDVKAVDPWFRRILLECIKDSYRTQQGLTTEESLEDVARYSLYRQITEVDPWPYSDSVHLDFLASFRDADVWAVLDRIAVRYRAPLALVHLEGFTPAQVARTFGMELETVLARLERGRNLFERELWSYACEHGLLARPEGA